jgi:hypothetical protein
MMSRKDLVRNYRERTPPRGVFRVTNRATGHQFLDAGADMPALWNRHRFQLNFGNHPNALLQAEWKAGPEEGFVFEVVAELTYDADGPHDVRADLAALLSLCLEEGKAAGAVKL